MSPAAGLLSVVKKKTEEEDAELLRAVAAAYHRLLSGVDFEDLVQAGAIGLMHARRLYDPGRGVKFSSFASRRIRGAMQDWIRGEHKRCKRHGKTTPRPRFTPISRMKDPQIADAGATADIQAVLDRDQVEILLARLKQNQRATVTLYFLHAFTLKRIGFVLGISESWASNLLHRGVEAMREHAQER